jgi:uncharacterized CHY-type Zn-finger protein
MSGLISSLLIEPVVRQARRLSQQWDTQLPSADEQPEPTSDAAEPAPPNANNGNNSGIISAAAHGQCPGTRQPFDLTKPCGNPSTVSPIDGYDQHHMTEHSNPSDPIRQDANLIMSQFPSEQTSNAFDHRHFTASNSDIATAIPPTNPSMEDAGRYHTPDMEELGGRDLLPEDDGMGILRKKIHAIRDQQSSNIEKARLIHELMTENYNASRGNPSSKIAQLVSSAPGTPVLQTSKLSNEPSAVSESTIPGVQRHVQYDLTAEDLKPTFAPKVEPDVPLGDEDLDTEEVEEAQLGCQHYKRNVKLQCYACKKWYTCRFCHDEVEDHHLDRPKTENMLCMLCGHPQPAAQACRSCGEQAAQYYCNVCKLWDNDSKKSIYHCADCGICRIGQGLGKDFFHCKTCCVCLPISIENTHRCIERSTQCDCPICGEYMFTSPETVVFMRCGHSIHQKCLNEYSKSSYRCPVCSKTITNMETTFRNLDRTIESQPMPAEFKDTKALVYCNDCGAKSVVKYHWLGLKCDMCESYNTAQLRLLQGDFVDGVEESGEDEGLRTHMRSSSHSQGTEDAALALAALRLDTNPVPGQNPDPRLNAPSSAEPNGRFASYSLTRGRAVSPVISNYFGIPPDRGTERSQSASIFGRTSKDNEDEDYGEVRFWGTKFKYRYGFLSRETESADGAESEKEDDDASGSGSDEEEDEEDDDNESIDIFGHR